MRRQGWAVRRAGRALAWVSAPAGLPVARQALVQVRQSPRQVSAVWMATVVRLTTPARWLPACLRQQQQAPTRVPEPGDLGQAWVAAKQVRRVARVKAPQVKVPVEVAARALDKEAIPHPCGPACLHA